MDSQNKHLSCFKPKPNVGGEQQLPKIGSWVVNIGGAIHLCEQGTGSTITCQVSEGLLIPLYSIIIALMGGSISLARRLPQIQKQVSQEYLATEQLPKISQFEFREQLILQIAQYTVAPFLAILAYYLVEPSNTTNSIALAFMAGFSSETILRMVRSIADKIMPEMTVQQRFGAIAGVIRFEKNWDLYLKQKYSYLIPRTINGRLSTRKDFTSCLMYLLASILSMSNTSPMMLMAE